MGSSLIGAHGGEAQRSNPVEVIQKISKTSTTQTQIQMQDRHKIKILQMILMGEHTRTVQGLVWKLAHLRGNGLMQDVQSDFTSSAKWAFK